MIFSIVIPTWNNLSYLQNCIVSIRKNASFVHQIFVVVNEGKDGTIEWLEKEQIEYIHHPTNVGICVGLNSATPFLKSNFFVYMNDDMYVLPHWDQALANEIQTIPHQLFMLSSTMIEPFDTGNKCVVVQNFGTGIENFEEQKLISFHKENPQPRDWNGASWPPFLVPIELWKKVGGFSEEFSPGMYSDPDFSMKLWAIGVRYFKGLGNSVVYHFGKKSTHKLGKNRGRSIFLNKWNITANFFYRKYLKMGSDWTDELPEFKISFFQKLIHQFKKLKDS